MASVAAEGRSAFVTAFFVTFVLTLALAPWQHSTTSYVRVSLDDVKRPPVIVAMELDREPGLIAGLVELVAPTFGSMVIAPPVHPDARPYPHGMLIHPPAARDRIAIAIPSALDRMLSTLLAPWQSDSL